MDSVSSLHYRGAGGVRQGASKSQWGKTARVVLPPSFTQGWRTDISFFNPLSRSSASSTLLPNSPPRLLLLYLVAFRVVNTLLVQSYFNPDEYWQGPEVAHWMVFGYGHLTWEWSGAARLRSVVHPLVFAALYQALRILRCDSRWALAFGPRLLQAVFAAVGDLYIYRLGTRIFGARAGRWALACSLTSWFNFYCITRTFSNSMETVLTIVALYLWPMDYCNNEEISSSTTTLTSKFKIKI